MTFDRRGIALQVIGYASGILFVKYLLGLDGYDEISAPLFYLVSVGLATLFYCGAWLYPTGITIFITIVTAVPLALVTLFAFAVDDTFSSGPPTFDTFFYFLLTATAVAMAFILATRRKELSGAK